MFDCEFFREENAPPQAHVTLRLAHVSGRIHRLVMTLIGRERMVPLIH